MTALMSKKLSREYGFEDVIQLAGTRMTTVKEMPTEPDTMLLTSYRPRNVTPCAEVGSLYPGAEVDLVLVIIGMCSNSFITVANFQSDSSLLTPNWLVPFF